MSDLNERQVAALRALSRGEVIAAGPTRAALLRRGLIAWSHDELGRRITVEITDAGREKLAEIDRWAAARDGERSSEATLSPGATVRDGLVIPDANFLQLLSLLDHGVRITRTLYRQWRIERAGTLVGAIDPARLDLAIRAALDVGLVDLETGVGPGVDNRSYRLVAAPIHLARNDHETWCGRRILRAGGDRIRYTTGSADGPVHQRCVERSVNRRKQAGQ